MPVQPGEPQQYGRLPSLETARLTLQDVPVFLDLAYLIAWFVAMEALVIV